MNSVSKTAIKYQLNNPKILKLRDFARNLAYHVDTLASQPLIIEKYGQPAAVVLPIEALLPTTTTKPLSELSFFQNASSNKSRSSAGQTASSLRKKAWSR